MGGGYSSLGVRMSPWYVGVWLQERNLAWHSEGIKMTLGSERPHLLTVDNDAFGGVVIYHLKVSNY